MRADAKAIAGQGGPTARPTRRNGWYERATPDSYVLSRQWPPRFDLRVETGFPVANRRRLALQVRQDLWRELKDLRGFSPVVQIDAGDQGMSILAGGQLQAGATPQVVSRLEALLDDPAKRVRWMSWAQERTS